LTTAGFDPRRASAFAERMRDVLNGGALALMASLGHRTGLFDVMARLAPSSSEAIAEHAGLDARYVREWLGAMVTGGVVEYDPERSRYALPAEHAACLSRAARPHNLGASAQWIPLLGGVEDEIVACFERGGGVPHASFGRFHAVMVEQSDQSVVARLLESILPLVPGSAEALAAGIDVLDVGCGRGRALLRMARAWPKSRFAGYDLSPDAIADARAEAQRQGLANLRFEVRDLAELDEREAFDLVTAFDTIHTQARPAQALAAVARALRPAGSFLMQEIAGTGRLERDAEHPFGPLLYTISCLYSLTVSLAEGGAGLGAMWGAECALRMLAEAGFARRELRSLPGDPVHHYYLARRG
jgi:SAM-dependent methyltransferase